MSDKTAIQWTDATWNPVRGCSRVSEGCRNCYAERIAARMSGPGQWGNGFASMTPSGPRWTGVVRLIPEMLDQPLRWKRPRRIFVNSTSDLFHESLTDGAILRVFEVMLRCPQHTFQILTKRPERMLGWHQRWADLTGESPEPKLARGPEETLAAHPSPRGRMFAEYLETLGKEPPPGRAWPTFDWMDGMRWWPTDSMNQPNIWLGVSVEDQVTADERIPLLLQTQAAKRFVSYEPGLGPVAFRDRFGSWLRPYRFHNSTALNDSSQGPDDPVRPALDWIIVGGESGPGARPFDVAWARETVRQCCEAGVACFVKQLGAHLHWDGIQGGSIPLFGSGTIWTDHAGAWCQEPIGGHRGDPEDWPEDLRVREFPR